MVPHSNDCERTSRTASAHSLTDEARQRVFQRYIEKTGFADRVSYLGRVSDKKNS